MRVVPEGMSTTLGPGAGRTEKPGMFAGDALERKPKFGRKKQGLTVSLVVNTEAEQPCDNG